MDLTNEERCMDYRGAKNVLEHYNNRVKAAYAAWYADDNAHHENLIDHMRRCKKAEHDRTMHEMFMAAMGWL
jgi:hypothetical protein